jgi:serine/threonine protein kinase
MILDKQGKRIGRGGSGYVYKIEHIETGKSLVWKEVPVEKNEWKKIENEAEKVMEINSPFVCRVLEKIEEEEEEMVYVIEEMYEGTLGNYIEELKKNKTMIPKEV